MDVNFNKQNSLKTGNELYNLVYRKVDNSWETSIFYLKKLPKENSEHKLFEKNERIYDGKNSNRIASRGSGLEMCSFETISVHCDGSCNGPCDGFGCPTGQCLYRSVTYESCASGGGGSGGSSDPGGSSSGYGGGSSDPYTYSPNNFDNPVFDDPNYVNAIRRYHLWSSLGDVGQIFYTIHIDFFDQVNQYSTNNWSYENYAFAREILSRKFESPDTFTSITPFLIEKQIDDSQLDPCAKSVFQQIKNTTNNDFAKVLAKLGADNSLYNTTMKTEHNSYTDANGNMVQVTAPANTVPNASYNYTIYINPDYDGKTKLFIANLLLHELIHAYFFSLRDDFITSGNNSGLNDFNYLFDLYVKKKHPESMNSADIHHQQMAIDYVNAIANALQEFQPGLPQQVYNDLAWAGLIETPVFQSINPTGSASWQRIVNRISAEQSGHPIGQGTPQEQINYGQPCN